MSLNTDFLKNFSNRWYKPLVGLGIIISIIGLTQIYFIQPEKFLYLGLFLFFFGIGEWTSHREVNAQRNAYWNPDGNLIQIVRIRTIHGILFYILAIVFLFMFFILFFTTNFSS